MNARGWFLDTNVLVYAFADDGRAARAEGLVGAGCCIGVQGLTEFTDVARRKLGMTWGEVGEALASIRRLVPLSCRSTSTCTRRGSESPSAMASRHSTR